MANQKISELNSIGVGGLDDSDLFVLVDSSATETKHIPYSSLKIPPFVGCDLSIAANTTGVDFTSGADIVWDLENTDTHGFHDPSTNPNRITIPPSFGGMYFDVAASAQLEGVASARDNASQIVHNNAAGTAKRTSRIVINAEQQTIITVPCVMTSVLVDSGDYFVFNVNQNTDTSVTVSTYSWFTARLIGQ